MSPFIFAAFWAFLPTVGGTVYPKIAVILFGMGVYALRDNRRGLFLLAAMAVSSVHSANLEWSLIGMAGFWTYGMASVFCYLLLMGMPTKLNWLRWLGVALSVHALVQVLAGWDPLFDMKALQYGRAAAWIGSPIDLGAILALAAPAAGPWLPLILAGIWACGSRGAALGVLFAFASNRMRLLLLPLLLVPLFMTKPKDVARAELARVAWRGFLEAPWFGHGPNTYATVLDRLRTPRLDAAVGTGYRQAHAHNDILEALCSTGIVGLVAYLLLLWPLRRNRSLVALFIVMKFNPVPFEVLAAAALIAANELWKRECPVGSSNPRGRFSFVPDNPSLPYPPEQA